MITFKNLADNVIGAGPHIVINFDTDSEREQLQVLLEAAAIFAARNERYCDNWKRQGWRGSLFKLRLKVERAWDTLWGAPAQNGSGHHPTPDVDDLLDAINCAAFVVRAVRDGDRDGNWCYPS